MTENVEHPVDLLPELAMGVLPEHEATHLRNHLADCETCTDEFMELVRVTNLLPFAAEELAPAPEMRDGVMERIAREPRSLATHRESRARRWVLQAAAGFALLVAIGAGLAGYLVGASGDESGDRRETRVVEAAAQGTLQSARVQNGSFAATLVRAPGAGEGFAWLEGMPPLPAGKQYQAWFTKDMQRFEPSTVFSDGGGVWLPADAPLEQYAALGFTIEDEGGARAPTQAPFAVVDLRKTVFLP